LNSCLQPLVSATLAEISVSMKNDMQIINIKDKQLLSGIIEFRKLSCDMFFMVVL
jgi:hypothetical protein